MCYNLSVDICWSVKVGELTRKADERGQYSETDATETN